MKLAKITCEIRYRERAKLFAGLEAIYTDLLQEQPKKLGEIPIPGLRLEDKKKKRIMLIDPMRGVIDIEQPPNVGFCKDLVMQFFKSVDKRISIPQVARYGLRSTWLQEYKGNFQDLLNKCKQRIFGSSSLVEKVSDVGAVFDYYIDDGKKISVTTGPMGIKQLKDRFLVFEPESFPPLFLYVDVDLGDITTKQLSTSYLSDFFDTAIKEGERLSKEIVTQVGIG